MTRKYPAAVGLGSLFRIGCILVHGDGCAADDGARGIDDCASHGSIHGRLGTGYRGDQRAKQSQQGEETKSRSWLHLALLKIGVDLLLDVVQRTGRAGIAGAVSAPRKVLLTALSQVSDKI